jgi:DNA repair exonuclease SbcCD ATPase subunit
MFNIQLYSKKKVEKEQEEIREEYLKLERSYEDNNDEIKKLNEIITTKDIKYNKNKYEEYIEKQNELEIKINTKRIKEEINKDLKQKILELKSYKYDENCEYCMKNSMTKDKISYSKQLETNEQELNKIGQEIKDLEIYIKKNMTTVTMYENYNKLKEEKDEATDKIETIEVKQQMIKLKLEGLSNSIKMKDTILMKIKNYDMNKEIMEQITNLEKINEEIRKEVNKEYDTYLDTQKEIMNINNLLDLSQTKLNKIQNDIEIKENKIKSYEDNQDTIKHLLELNEIKAKYEKTVELNNKLKTELNECNEKLNKIKLDQLMFNELNKELNKIKLDKDEYEIISKFISGEEFTIKIMQETILPTISENMNNMLRMYSDYTIKMVLNKDTNDSIYIYKLDGSNLSLNGGYESHLINLIFRMVFTKISGMIRTNFIIIDEAFDASDMANKSNIKNIIDFMDNIYDWGIIISHDAYIRTNFDKHITIKKITENGTNKEKQFISI